MSTGTVTHILGRKKTFCLIVTPAGVEVFAHQREFVDPSKMQPGMPVQFRIKLTNNGKRPEATDVQAA